MIKLTENIKQIVDDINQYTYEMNVKLAKAQEALFKDDLSMKQTMVIDYVHKHKNVQWAKLRTIWKSLQVL